MTTSPPEVIFSTVHGSTLYGLAHANSDRDVFTVTTSTRTKARHSVSLAEDGTQDDRVSLSWNRFLHNAMQGSHQSVEAMFSTQQIWNPKFLHLRPMILGTRIQGSDVFHRYERTIKAFAFGDFKRRRHACRLALNLSDLRSDGRFNPTLTPSQIDLVNRLANELEGRPLVGELFGETPSFIRRSIFRAPIQITDTQLTKRFRSLANENEQSQQKGSPDDQLEHP
ncbi:MAG TPA: hypothetical protein VFU07_05150 [Candidatus Lumbricidophila sp.]|nr:hypothetical protein [Candidatus Lumbricidophila sp.]